MANLTPIDMQKFETLLSMNGGYVLNFTNQSFQRYVKAIVNIDIDSNKYLVYGSSKAKRLRAFWEIEDDKIVGRLLEELVNYYKAQIDLERTEIVKVSEKIVSDCQIIALRLQGKSYEKQSATTEKDFLTKEIDEVPIISFGLPGPVVTILENRIIEIKKCLKYSAPLAVVFLSGSVLEGILLNIATQKPKDFNQATSSPKMKNGDVRPLPEWSLSSLIDVAHELGYLDLDIKKHSHSLRDFRNYIHPFEQMSSGFSPDSHTAEIAWKVLKAALHDINSKK